MKNFSISTQLLVAIAASGGTFLYGICLGWSSPSIPILLRESPFEITLNDAAWSVSMMSLGVAVSCIPAGVLRNYFGTKSLLAVYSVPSIIGWFLLTFPSSAKMIILGRFLTGIAGGGYTFIVPIYIGEIASKEIRGTLLALFEVTVKAGILFIYIIASLLSLKIANAICVMAVTVYFMSSMFLPETPIYLMRSHKIQEAKHSLVFLRGKDSNIENELKELEILDRTHSTTFKTEMKTPSTRRAFLIIIFMFIFFQTSGNNAILFYLTTILIQSEMELDPFICTIVLGVIKLITVIVTLILVDRCGRRPLLIVSFSIMIIGHIGNGIFFHLKAHEINHKGLEWVPLVCICIFFIGFCLGIGSVSYVLLGELFSISAKKIVAPMAQSVNYFLSFLLTLAFPILSNFIGIHLMFYAFAFCCVLGMLFTLFVVPETKGKSLNDIQKLLS